MLFGFADAIVVDKSWYQPDVCVNRQLNFVTVVLHNSIPDIQLGSKFGKWTVKNNSKRHCTVECECGFIALRLKRDILSGRTRSCQKCSKQGKFININGEIHNQLDWTKKLGITGQALNQRIGSGWDPALAAVTKKSRLYKCSKCHEFGHNSRSHRD